MMSNALQPRLILLILPVPRHLLLMFMARHMAHPTGLHPPMAPTLPFTRMPSPVHRSLAHPLATPGYNVPRAQNASSQQQPSSAT